MTERLTPEREAAIRAMLKAEFGQHRYSGAILLAEIDALRIELANARAELETSQSACRMWQYEDSLRS